MVLGLFCALLAQSSYPQETQRDVPRAQIIVPQRERSEEEVRAEVELRNIFADEAAAILLDLPRKLEPPKLPEDLKGEARLNWVYGLYRREALYEHDAYLGLPIPFGVRSATFRSAWLKRLSQLSPAERKLCLSLNGAWIGQLPPAFGRDFRDYAATDPSYGRATTENPSRQRVKVQPTLLLNFRDAKGIERGTARPLIPVVASQRVVGTADPIAPPPPFLPSASPALRSSNGDIGFVPGRIVPLYTVFNEATRGLAPRWVIDERLGERLVYIQGRFTADKLRKAIQRITIFEAVGPRKSKIQESADMTELKAWFEGARPPLTVDMIVRGGEMSGEDLEQAIPGTRDALIAAGWEPGRLVKVMPSLMIYGVSPPSENDPALRMSSPIIAF